MGKGLERNLKMLDSLTLHPKVAGETVPEFGSASNLTKPGLGEAVHSVS